jgi:chorismate dehydratase
MPGLRISAISFLNTAPLMWDFEHGDAGKNFEIAYTVPSQCAAALAANQADIGIIPAFTYAEIPGLVILPNIAIAARDHVRSILLISRKPIEEVRTVATDTSSRTSVALTQVLFTKFFGGPREFAPYPPQLEAMLANHDAALLIGDSALQVSLHDSPYHLYDLAHEWRVRTGKPFVFAFWAVRLDALQRLGEGLNLAHVFQQSRDHGLQPGSIAVIAREWAARLGLTEDEITTYLTQNIHYGLDRENHSGLQLFFRYSHEIGLIQQLPHLRFLGPVAFSKSCP